VKHIEIEILDLSATSSWDGILMLLRKLDEHVQQLAKKSNGLTQSPEA
jgi:hypothetical protein